MPRDDSVPTEVWKGRIITTQTKWWAERNVASNALRNLYCIHSVALSMNCEDCNDCSSSR